MPIARTLFNQTHRSWKIVVALCSVFCVSCSLPLAAQENLTYDLLPTNTQAVIWVPSADELMDRWSRTQLSELIQDESIAPFFQEKREELEARFLEAGWRLSIRPEDVGQYSTGQLGFAWTDSDKPVKPYGMMLIADVENDPVLNARMMKEFEDKLDPDKSKKKVISHGDIKITQYILPPRPGEYIKQVSHFAVVPGEDQASALLLVADEVELIKNLIDKAKGDSISASLSDDAVFVQGRELAKITGAGQIEYFVRPLGFAEVIRSIAGKRSKSHGNWLTALKNQGFDAIQCVAGEIEIGTEDMDVNHHGYVFARMPLTKSAKALEFPNQASVEIPSFIGEDISSLLVTNWVANRAFWELEGLVDEIANTAGVFDEVVEGFKRDSSGPRVDLKEVLPIFTNDIYSIADNRPGEAAVDSRRNLLALKLKDPAKMQRILKEAMKNEPDAEQIDFKDHQIWQVVEDSGTPASTEFQLDDDFGDFTAPPAQGNGQQQQQQQWLSNWAITVYDDYLLFASHLEMIQDAIESGLVHKESPFVQTDDYRRTTSAIREVFGQNQGSAWRVLRASKAYRIQYELFRRGELRKSESMVASILDRLIQKDDELESKEQKISGEGLPDFSTIEKYLEPSAFKVVTTQAGWEFGSLLLSKDYQPKPAKDANPGVTRSSAYGTATAPLELETKR